MCLNCHDWAVVGYSSWRKVQPPLLGEALTAEAKTTIFTSQQPQIRW
jgi:hypothetical protein